MSAPLSIRRKHVFSLPYWAACCRAVHPPYSRSRVRDTQESRKKAVRQRGYSRLYYAGEEYIFSELVTSSFALMLAPSFSKREQTLVWPSRDAWMRAVLPFYDSNRKIEKTNGGWAQYRKGQANRRGDNGRTLACHDMMRESEYDGMNHAYICAILIFLQFPCSLRGLDYLSIVGQQRPYPPFLLHW